MAASMIVTPVFSLLFDRKCRVSEELTAALFPSKFPADEYVRENVRGSDGAAEADMSEN